MPARGVQASSRVLWLRIIGLTGCIGGTAVSCSGAAIHVDGMVGVGAIALVVGFVCWLASRIMEA